MSNTTTTFKKIYDVITEITIGIAIFAIIFMGFSVLTTPKPKTTVIYKDRLIICYPKTEKQISKTKPKLECIEHITKSK